MIKSFHGKDTEKLFNRQFASSFPSEIRRVALKKLMYLDASDLLEDLKVPPGNRLEKLFGKRHMQHSIRINDQWRICFRWHQVDAYDVEITDYH